MHIHRSTCELILSWAILSRTTPSIHAQVEVMYDFIYMISWKAQKSQAKKQISGSQWFTENRVPTV